MSESTLLSSVEIVSRFVADLSKRSDLDPNTVKVLQDLHKAGKLTKISLVRSLEEQRKIQRSQERAE